MWVIVFFWALAQRRMNQLRKYGFDREIKEISSDILVVNQAAQKTIIQKERKFYPAFYVSNTQQSQ